MPELPEVETVRTSLEPYLVGQTIHHITILHPKSFVNQNNYHLLGQSVVQITRRGKYLIIELDRAIFLLIHLKMTGQLLYKSSAALAGGGHPAPDTMAQLPGKHTRVIIDLINKHNQFSQLFFNDMRIFGWIKVVDKQSLKQELFHLGPDANLDDISLQYLQEKFSKRKLPIKQVLMDNSVLTGIGNIYASEILFAAHISPIKPACKITLEETKLILAHTKRILHQAIAAGGTTFDGRYVDALGQAGNFVEKLQVYGKANQPCSVCQAILVNIKLGGRSTVYCPQCQKN